jgi:hypothetical protein
VPSRTGGAEVTGGVHAFFRPRSSSAAAPPPPRPSCEQPAVGGTLGDGGRSGGSTAASASRGAIVAGVRLADHERTRKMNTPREAEMPGTTAQAWKVTYDVDATTEELDELELRRALIVSGMVPPGRVAPCRAAPRSPRSASQARHPRSRVLDDAFKAIVAALTPGFEYLEDRILGRCQAPYSCAAEFELFRLVQLFDPAFAKQGATTASVRALAAIKPLGVEEELLEQLCGGLPAYLAAAADVHVNRADVADFTDIVLAFWRDHAEQLPGWALAARIVFAIW